MDNLVEYFQFLDDLRESGITNMFGAASYLEDEFELSKKDAKKVLLDWMKTFDSQSTAEERVAKLNGTEA
jgi:hypothetical protein